MQQLAMVVHGFDQVVRKRPPADFRHPERRRGWWDTCGLWRKTIALHCPGQGYDSVLFTSRKLPSTLRTPPGGNRDLSIARRPCRRTRDLHVVALRVLTCASAVPFTEQPEGVEEASVPYSTWRAIPLACRQDVGLDRNKSSCNVGNLESRLFEQSAVCLPHF